MLRYITKIFNLRIVFWKNFVNNIVEYSDLKYIGLINRKKSTKTYIFIFADKQISHFL